MPQAEPEINEENDLTAVLGRFQKWNQSQPGNTPPAAASAQEAPWQEMNYEEALGLQRLRRAAALKPKLSTAAQLAAALDVSLPAASSPPSRPAAVPRDATAVRERSSSSGARASESFSQPGPGLAASPTRKGKGLGSIAVSPDTGEPPVARSEVAPADKRNVRIQAASLPGVDRAPGIRRNAARPKADRSGSIRETAAKDRPKNPNAGPRLSAPTAPRHSVRSVLAAREQSSPAIEEAKASILLKPGSSTIRIRKDAQGPRTMNGVGKACRKAPKTRQALSASSKAVVANAKLAAPESPAPGTFEAALERSIRSGSAGRRDTLILSAAKAFASIVAATGGAAPPEAGDAAKITCLKVRLSVEDRATIEERAKSSGLSVAAFMRHCTLDVDALREKLANAILEAQVATQLAAASPALPEDSRLVPASRTHMVRRGLMDRWKALFTGKPQEEETYD